MFDNLENENIREIEKNFEKRYPQYFGQTNKYVYGCADDWIIIYEKMESTINNENRENIICDKFAEYTADQLKIILIINKFCPHNIVNSLMSYPEIYSIINYNTGDIIKNDKFRLTYYKSVLVPYFYGIMNRKNCNYTGFFISWYDNGFVSEKGNYINGEKDGIWKYGSINQKTINQKPIDQKANYCDTINFTTIEYKKGNVINICDNVDNVNINKNKNMSHSIIVYQNVTYFDLLFKNINFLLQYTDYFFPYFWKK